MSVMGNFHSKAKFAERLNIALDQLGWHPRGRAKQLKLFYEQNGYNLSEKTFQKWLSGQSYPDWDHLLFLIQLTNRTIEYLVYGKELVDFDVAVKGSSVNYLRVSKEELLRTFIVTFDQAITFNLVSLHPPATAMQIFNAFIVKLKLPPVKS